MFSTPKVMAWHCLMIDDAAQANFCHPVSAERKLGANSTMNAAKPVNDLSNLPQHLLRESGERVAPRQALSEFYRKAESPASRRPAGSLQYRA
jgi:hypothetical protein